MARPTKTQRYRLAKKRQAIQRVKGEPIDYGITKKQFHSILNKAAQPIDKSDSSTA